MDYIERNYNLIRERMIEQTDISLEYGREIIESELDAGALNVIVKPIVKAFYKYWSDKDARVGTLEQIRITLESAKELVKNGEITQERFERVIDKNFSIYLKNDQTDRACKKNHNNYKKLKEITKSCFITQVEESILLLRTKEEVKDYNELSRITYKTKENAYKALKRQLDFNDAGISIVEQDDSILNVIAGKNIILKALRKGFEQTKKTLIEELDQIFN
ncbi:MAG: hypothetical protein EAX89_05800 [Candidatus Lokiarchaeota archaeon]|nr:hypothetical protein [Candidatus Lokiarchaeota archaeon]